MWGEIESIQDGYWVHKDTGVKTYFGLEEASIVGGIMNSPSWMYDCSEVNIPEGVTSLGGDCFRDCTSLTSITLPESVISLGTYCFYRCSYLNSINIPESVTILGDRCFRNCYALASITLPESVISLGDYCFYNCSSLTSIIIPENVTILGVSCFQNCSFITIATVLPAIPPTLGTNVFNNVHTSFSIKVRPPYVDTYKAATNWTAYAAIISAI